MPTPGSIRLAQHILIEQIPRNTMAADGPIRAHPAYVRSRQDTIPRPRHEPASLSTDPQASNRENSSFGQPAGEGHSDESEDGQQRPKRRAPDAPQDSRDPSFNRVKKWIKEVVFKKAAGHILAAGRQGKHDESFRPSRTTGAGNLDNLHARLRRRGPQQEQEPRQDGSRREEEPGA